MTSSWTQDRLGPITFDLYSPKVSPRFGLLFLLDSDGVALQRSQPYARLIQQHNLACITLPPCPTWWSNRPCAAFLPELGAEQFVLRAVVPEFRARWNLAPRALAIAGIGMGGQGALRLAFRHPDVFPIVAAIAPAIDFHELYGEGTPLDDLYDSKEQCRQDTALMHVHPSHYPPHLYFSIDPEDAFWFRGNDRLHEKLGALGVSHEADMTTTGGGHTWEYFGRMAEPALRFVVDGLEKESRRLL